MPRKRTSDRPPRTKADRALSIRRTEEVLRIRLDGAEFWDVREYVREQEKIEGSCWFIPEGQNPMSDQQLYRYVKASDDLIAKSSESTRKKRVAKHLAQRRNLYAKAVAAGDNRTALAILRDEAELLALYPDPDTELRKLLLELTRKLEEVKAGGQGGFEKRDPPVEVGG